MFLLNEYAALNNISGFYLNTNIPGHHATLLMKGLRAEIELCGFSENSKREMRGNARLSELDVHIHALTRASDLLYYFEGPLQGFGI